MTRGNEPNRPVAGDDGDEDRDDEERDEAGLRVGEEEAREQEGDDQRGDRDPESPVPRRVSTTASASTTCRP